ncbi:hypothetical protein AB0H83_51405 [Dactylosporangium sp. NPDC050688]|uniref:hypothetical protein n=1 Tax=Dactylosporangium sp. NPDC050688 TaxID=3157217 RepID=UPI0033FB7DE2
MITALTGGLAGCTASQPRSQRPKGIIASLPPGPPSPAADQPVWLGTAPQAVLTGANGERQAGILLSSRWFSPSGNVQTTAPDGSPVRWPAAVAAPAPADIDVRIPTHSHPARVDVRLFHGELDGNGVPTSNPRTLACRNELSSQAATASGCRLGNDQEGLLVHLAEHRFPVIVLYAEWYVPVADRPPGAQDNAVVSASWGFRIVVR